MKINIADMTQRNIRKLPSQEIGVRPGFRRLFSAGAGRTIVSAFSVKNIHSEEVRHYIVDSATDETAFVSGSADPKITIYDENFVPWQVYDIRSNKRPSVVTHAVIIDQIMISSPDFDTVWGIVGSALTRAEKVDSVNPATSGLDVPRVFCAAWTHICVIYYGPNIYISDGVTLQGGSPRTFVAFNVQAVSAGPIYGMHVTAGGSLVVCATEGVFALPESANASGQIVLPDWQKLSDHQTLSYNSSAHALGRLYGLTRRGFALIDQEMGTEVPLDDPYQPRGYGRRVQRPDWREGRIYPTQRGPLCTDEVGAFHLADIHESQRSWHTMTHDQEEAKVRGTLRQRDGDELLVTEQGVYRWEGNFDGVTALDSENADEVQGVAAHTVQAPPESSPTVRYLHVGADNTSGNILMAHRGTKRDAPGSGTQKGLVIGTSSWDTGETYMPPALRSLRGAYADPTDDVAIEVGAEKPLTRINTACEVQVEGIDVQRPTGR